MGPGQYPQYTRADFGQQAVGSSPQCDHRQPRRDNRRAQQSSRTMKSRTISELMVSKSPIHILKSCLSHDMNESVAYFEEHPELKFDGCNSKRAVVSAFKNPDRS